MMCYENVLHTPEFLILRDFFGVLSGSRLFLLCLHVTRLLLLSTVRSMMFHKYLELPTDLPLPLVNIRYSGYRLR